MIKGHSPKSSFEPCQQGRKQGVLYGKVLKPDDTNFYREDDDKAKARV